MKSLQEQLREVEEKIKTLKENNLENTTTYLMLINSKILLKDQLARLLISQ
jgi:hypothetical protein